MEFDEEKVCEAVSTLFSGYDSVLLQPKSQKTGAKKVDLLAETPVVALTIVQKRFARMQYRKLKCEIPNPVRTPGTCDVCLIIKDISTEKNFDQERAVDRFKEFLRTAKVEGITEVLTFTQLRTEYKAFEAKRKLLGRYDLFLADERIYGRLAKVLGVKFFTKNKFPIQIDVSDAGMVAENVKSAISATYLTVNGKGPQCSMELASLEQGADKITANVNFAVTFVKEHFPGGWNNIRSLYLKLGKFSLPIYIDIASPNAVVAEAAPKLAGFASAVQEITTVRDAKVKISADGSIKVIKTRGRKSKNKPTKKVD